MMKKKIATAIAAMFFLLGAMNPALAYDESEIYKTVEIQQHQIFDITCEYDDVRYEIDPPSKAHIVSRDGGNVKIMLDGLGDVYVRTIYSTGDVFVFRIIVSESVKSSSVEIARPNPATENPSELAQQVLELVNRERAKVGVKPLQLTKFLLDSAAIRAEEISRSYSHTRPDGRPCSSIMKDGQYMIGENIAAGSSTAEAVMEQWMNSPGHRANILNSDYTELGVGYFYKSDSPYGNYWVQIFKRPMSAARR